MKRRRYNLTLLGFMLALVLMYFRLWLYISSLSNNGEVAPRVQEAAFDTQPYTTPDSMKGKTKIVGFCNFNFRQVGEAWYQRMSRLGYNNHVLVATDQPMADFLRRDTNFRYQVWLHEPMTEELKSRPKPDHALLELLMAVRWKFLLRELQQGVHVVLTDVDNIFSRYLDVDKGIAQADPTVDVWHAYATKYPRKLFSRMGFVVCSGMSWWRASPAAIRFSQLMQTTCGDMCDDQRVLNNLLASPTLNMKWEWTERASASKITNLTTDDPRFWGVPTVGISGTSNVTGHKARVWDRDFALRGLLRPNPCPSNNWVSMPILDAKDRASAWRTKLESFQQWDEHCGTGKL